MPDLWLQIHDLFDTDDGSLPDIFVENLSSDQVINIYRWVRSLCDVCCDNGEPKLWHCEQQRDVSIKPLDDPAQLVINGHAEPFRHGLANLALSDVAIPQLTVEVTQNEISFDYRMGPEWGSSQVAALFDFLWAIQQIAPDARISQRHEGGSEESPSFTRAWYEFKREKITT